MAKNYIDNLSEETKKGMLEKAEQGIYPSAAPLGYRNDTGANQKKVLEPDPESAPMFRQLFERMGGSSQPTENRLIYLLLRTPLTKKQRSLPG
jgi:DNA invertase Pin-like site-specific DNA recombinase